MDQVQVQHRFTIVDPDTGYSFTDALYFPLDEYPTIKDSEIEAQKQARFDNWKKAIDDASKVPPPTKQKQLADVTTRITEITKELDNLTLQKAELEK